MKNNITAVILTKGTDENLEKAVESVSWCDEIVIIVDGEQEVNSNQKLETRNYNKDKTRVFHRALNGDFAAQRNFALEKAKGEWVLYVDADEIVISQLANEIANLIRSNDRYKQLNGFCIRRKDYFGGRWLKYGETASVQLLRLGRRGKGKWEGCVHETWKIEGQIGRLEHPLLHYGNPSISIFLKKINFYSDLLVKQWLREKKDVSSISIVLFPVGKFIYNYIFLLGFLDGVAGLLLAMMMSFHSFLARSKYWLLVRQNIPQYQSRFAGRYGVSTQPSVLFGKKPPTPVGGVSHGKNS